MRVEYDIVVVGAGHAGCEAACAAARLGSRTLLITMDMNAIGQMSCNPAVGGIAKGQIVREIDALGGEMGKITDRSSIQFRMLNRSKGPAVWSPRSQCDRKVFIAEWIKTLTSIPRLNIWQDTVTELIIENDAAMGVRTQLGLEIRAKAVVLTCGTFLNGLMHFGAVQVAGGRIAEKAAYHLTEQLKNYGFTTGRLKTGTPPRLDKRSIDFSKMTEQHGDDPIGKFSFGQEAYVPLRQMSCWITYTNKYTHDILRDALPRSPLYNGQIQSTGPRYCPSIETKIVTFAEKDEHQLFLEPEGIDSNEYYVNGFSSSLPLDAQIAALHTVQGLENCVFYRPGYAIEYDYFDPTQLQRSLETKKIENLFFAGQINGTTGYEEAAGQGIIAGINAHQKINELSPFFLQRDESYIGVLIDDLILKGVDEPYRMFTSRAEHRILLRQDNADARLTPKGIALGLVNGERKKTFLHKQEEIEKLLELLETTVLTPNETNNALSAVGEPPIQHPCKASLLLKRPNISFNFLKNNISSISNFCLSQKNITLEIEEEVEIKTKYQGYIDREKIAINKARRLEEIRIPQKINYDTILSLSTEARQKLKKHQPKTISEASRIPGVSPSDITALLIKFGR